MSDEDKQNAEQGIDKNVDGPTDPQELDKIKMTGEGAPGSHSAVFGLTPDGKTHTDTSHGTTTSKPAHSNETAVGGGKQSGSDGETGNTSSTGASGAGVADQMNKPGDAESTEDAGDKPGTGTGTDLGSQGTGEVGQQEGEGGSLLDKAKSYLGGGGSS